jgi:hypothetical protein
MYKVLISPMHALGLEHVIYFDLIKSNYMWIWIISVCKVRRLLVTKLKHEKSYMASRYEFESRQRDECKVTQISEEWEAQR